MRACLYERGSSLDRFRAKVKAFLAITRYINVANMRKSMRCALCMEIRALSIIKMENEPCTAHSCKNDIAGIILKAKRNLELLLTDRDSISWLTATKYLL